jgi:hypothetical protein
MRKFMVLMHGDGEAFARLTQEEAMEMIESLQTFEERRRSESAPPATHRLFPASTAKLIKLTKSRRTLLDGRFAETKEQFGGYHLAQADNAGQVIEWLELAPPAPDSTPEALEVIEEERSLP